MGIFYQKWHFAHPKISFAHPELPFLAKPMVSREQIHQPFQKENTLVKNHDDDQIPEMW